MGAFLLATVKKFCDLTHRLALMKPASDMGFYRKSRDFVKKDNRMITL